MSKTKKSNKGKAHAASPGTVNRSDVPQFMLPNCPFGNHSFTKKRLCCIPPGDSHPFLETEKAHGEYTTFNNGGFESCDTNHAICTLVTSNGPLLMVCIMTKNVKAVLVNIISQAHLHDMDVPPLQHPVGPDAMPIADIESFESGNGKATEDIDAISSISSGSFPEFISLTRNGLSTATVSTPRPVIGLSATTVSTPGPAIAGPSSTQTRVLPGPSKHSRDIWDWLNTPVKVKKAHHTADGTSAQPICVDNGDNVSLEHDTADPANAADHDVDNMVL